MTTTYIVQVITGFMCHNLHEFYTFAEAESHIADMLKADASLRYRIIKVTKEVLDKEYHS